MKLPAFRVNVPWDELWIRIDAGAFSKPFPTPMVTVIPAVGAVVFRATVHVLEADGASV